MSVFFFWLFGAFAVIAAVLCVTRRNPVYAAFFLLVALGAVAVEFLLLHAPFIAAMQIILYAGAIVVLFVFVIMLLSLRDEELGPEPPPMQKIAAALVAFAVFILLCVPAFRDSATLGARITDTGDLKPVPITVRVDDVLSRVALRHGLTVAELKARKPLEQEQEKRWLERVQGPRNEAAALGLFEYLPEGQDAEGPETAMVALLAEDQRDALARALGMPTTALEKRGRDILRGIEGEPSGAAADQKARIEELAKQIRIKADRYGSLEDFVGFLYSRYIVAFELVSILIFTAIAGVIVLARRRGFMGLGGASDAEGEQLL